MNTTIYPILGKQTVLPFYLSGIGISDPEYHVIRGSGLVSHQLLYTSDGSGTLEVGGERYAQKKGSLFYLPPAVPHRYYPESGGWKTCWIVFRGGYASEMLGALGLSGAKYTADADTGSLDLLFKRLLAAAGDPIGQERCSALLYEYILLAREQLLVPSKERSGGSSMIKPALELIESSYMRDLTLAELSEKAGVTPQHFCRVFKAKLGVRPLEYIARLRISKSKQLLTETDLPVGEIALRVGYRDQTYFGVVFKRYEGVSPGEFRRLGYLRI